MTPDAIRSAAFVVAHEIRRRRRERLPVEPWLLRLDAEVRREWSALGHRAVPPDTDAPPWKSTDQLAAEMGCSARHIRRTAHTHGGHKVGHTWVFPTD